MEQSGKCRLECSSGPGIQVNPPVESPTIALPPRTTTYHETCMGDKPDGLLGKGPPAEMLPKKGRGKGESSHGVPFPQHGDHWVHVDPWSRAMPSASAFGGS